MAERSHRRPAAEASEPPGNRAFPIGSTGKTFLTPADQEAVLLRLRRIEGQARGVQRLVQEQASCHDILMQIEAMRAALQRVKVVLGGCQVKHLVRDTFPEQPDAAEDLAQRVQDALEKL